jgi:hypothetical protein
VVITCAMLAGLAAYTPLDPGAAWAGEPALRTLGVPAELTHVTSHPEPSGIVWSPTLRRYLVVTDDTGLRSQGTRHAPWLLGLGEDGIFDKSPIPVGGVASINDAESICAGPAGTYFVVTSHAPNHDGRTSAARRQLLYLKEAAGKLALLARADLSKLLASGRLLGPKASEGRLDIEAIGYHAEALFIGLKFPLSEHGEALIVRIANVVEWLHGGELTDDAFQRFGAFSLCVPVGNRRVCQGLSDMTFLSDGSLVVTANAPKGGPPDYGGSLWHLPVPLGKKPPVLLHRFPGLKPEGVTLSPSASSLVIVFDRDQRPAQWIEIGLPPVK